MLKCEHVPPRRDDSGLRSIVASAKSLSIAHDGGSSPRPRVDVVSLVRLLAAAEPGEQQGPLAPVSCPAENRTPGPVLERSPWITGRDQTRAATGKWAHQHDQEDDKNHEPRQPGAHDFED